MNSVNDLIVSISCFLARFRRNWQDLIASLSDCLMAQYDYLFERLDKIISHDAAQSEKPVWSLLNPFIR